MPHADLVLAGTNRAAITGLDLPTPPPTRIYLSGYEYRITAPRVPLPPVLNVVKTLLNWVLPLGRVAKNVLYLKTPSSFVSSDPTALSSLAQSVYNAIIGAPANAANNWCSSTSLQGVTCRDLSGTSAQGTSTGAPTAGLISTSALPPQTCIAVSWGIAESYRGGKPRTYLPGIPMTASATVGGSAIDPAFAGVIDTTWTRVMTSINALSLVAGGSPVLGTVSYHTGHALRPTPLFRTFISVRVHERFDSQRRRSGPEASFAATPA